MVLKNNEKKEISRRYHREDQTIDEISKVMQLSPTTVQKYKDYGINAQATQTDAAPVAKAPAGRPAPASEAPNLSNIEAQQLINDVRELKQRDSRQDEGFEAYHTPISQSIERTTEELQWLKYFLQGFNIKQNTIDIIIRTLTIEGGVLPKPSALRADLINGMPKGSHEYVEFVIRSYNAELLNRQAQNIQNQNIPQTLQQGYQQPTLAQQLKDFQEIDRLLHGAREATPLNPEMERMATELQDLRRERTEELTNQLRREYDEKIQLGIAYRDVQEKLRAAQSNGNISENQVAMEETKEKWKLENIKMADKKESTQGWQDVAKSILTPILPAVLKTYDELKQEQQQMPMQPEQQMPPVVMLKGNCPQCGSEITFPSDSTYVICKCGKRCEVVVPPVEQQPAQDNINIPPESVVSPVEKPDISPVSQSTVETQKLEPVPAQEDIDELRAAAGPAPAASQQQPERKIEPPPDVEKNPVWKKGSPMTKMIIPEQIPEQVVVQEKTESPEITEKTENTEITEKTQSIKTSKEKSVASSATKKKPKKKDVKK